MKKSAFQKYCQDFQHSSGFRLSGVPLGMIDIVGQRVRYGRVRATDTDGRKYYYDVDRTAQDIKSGPCHVDYEEGLAKPFLKAAKDSFCRKSNGAGLKQLHIREIGFEEFNSDDVDKPHVAAFVAGPDNKVMVSVGDGRNVITEYILDNRQYQ